MTALPVLMYHEINAANRYAADDALFDEHMRYLYEHGFRSVVPEELPLPQEKEARRIMITFDDGHETDLTRAAPILLRYGFGGVSFVTSGYMGQPGYMTWKQVRELRESGFSIQSHTHSHPLLGTLGRERIREELAVSKRMIEDKVGERVTSIALPGGSFSPELPEIARETGYEYIFTSHPGTNSGDPGQESFNRMLIRQGTSVRTFAKVVNNSRGLYRYAVVTYNLKSTAKRIIGPGTYLALWKRYYK